MAISIRRLALVAALSASAFALLTCSTTTTPITTVTAKFTPNPPVTAETVIRNYRDFAAETIDYIAVLPSIGDCRPPDDLEKELAKERNIMVYMNAPADTAFKNHAVLYPVGSVIVKEKRRGLTVTALGGMIKRSKGFDPDHGDWEFFYANVKEYSRSAPAITALTKSDSGKLTNCIQCHNAVAEKDHVYASWYSNSEATFYHVKNPR